MRVERLSLANFRGFEQIELSFEDDLTVIAGVNGVGKSAILNAIAVLLSHTLREIAQSRAKPLLVGDGEIREGQRVALASAQVRTNGQWIDVSIQRTRPDPVTAEKARRDLDWLARLKAEAEGYPEHTPEFREKERYLRSLLTDAANEINVRLGDVPTETVRTGGLDAVHGSEVRIKDELRSRPNQPLAVFFSASRQLFKGVRTLPNATPLSVPAAFFGALDGKSLNLGHFVRWYRVQERLGGGRRHKIVQELQRVVHDFIPEFKALRVEEKPTPRFVVEKNGVPLVLDQLSDGERGLLTIVFDLTRRLAIANPERDDPIADGRAIVLIDEIELHLHPQWQRQVLRRFTETFKGCQFIVTTHSPQVIGEVEPRCLRFLIPEDDRIIAWTPPRSLGLDASRVLEELMDVRARNAEIDTALHELFELIEKEDFKTADQRIDALAGKLGEDDVELTRARSLITFLRGANEGDSKEP